MRFFEFIDMPLEEGGDSKAVRYNSEIGVLYAFANNGQPFDTANPQNSFDLQKIANSDKVFSEITKLLTKNYNEALFSQWTSRGEKIKSAVIEKMGSLPDQISWAGGSNRSDNAADVIFLNSSVAGISVKHSGGVTLANLTPAAIGLETERKVDVFSKYSQELYEDMKTKIFSEVLNIAKSQPGQPLAPKSEKYTITYDDSTDKYTCVGKKSLTADAQTILNSVKTNASWQRVFGDWFQENWAEKKAYAVPLFQHIASVFEKKIEEALSDNAKLANALRFAEVPYFYAAGDSLYYVPNIETVQDLKVKKLVYAEPDGTSQLFRALVGRTDSDQSATIDIYVRYANGMFEASPTVRVQNLSNPQFISWEKLL